MTEIEKATAPPYLGTLSDQRYEQMCMENSGEKGLWRLYAEEYKKQLRLTSSREEATRATINSRASRFGIQIMESKHIYRHLRNTFAPGKN